MPSTEVLFRKGLLRLLDIKDSDIRIMTLQQGLTAVDRGVHIGGAFSATIPLVSLYYGDIIGADVENPTRVGQDMFVLSKGHAVAAMASIYADLGYFDSSILRNSRSVESILNGHPGPLLPGVHFATGPLGQGVAVAQGLAMAGKVAPEFDVYCVTGDGELQEGVVWEAIMHAPQKHLGNLCMLVDKNEGQLDNHAQLIFPMNNLPAEIESFGWRVLNVDGTDYDSVLSALERFVDGPRDGKPTAIVCNSKKGFGSYSNFLNKHKVSLPEDLGEIELRLQKERRASRVDAYFAYEQELENRGHREIVQSLRARAEKMNLAVKKNSMQVVAGELTVRTRRAEERNKKIEYEQTLLPRLDPAKEYQGSAVITEALKVFAQDRRVVSVDADLGSTSGLEAGIAWVDQSRAVNIGIAESNMMCVGEAYAALGFNAWVSTFCPFFDWKVLRRTAVGYQERMEDMASERGWLSNGHGLDLTYLATAANFETKTNGATHMGNDDAIIFSGMAGLKIIDVSCPNLLLGVMKWVMAGNRGLNYVRVMRAPSAVIYPEIPEFEFGRAYTLAGGPQSRVHLISSGRGVHEILASAKLFEQKGITAEVIDMPSIDRKMLFDRLSGDGLVVIAEQNNGYIWNQLGSIVMDSRKTVDHSRILPINTRREDGSYQFIHSATYSQLLERFGLKPEHIVKRVEDVLGD